MTCGGTDTGCGDYVTDCGELHLTFAAGQGVNLGWTVEINATPLNLTDYRFEGKIGFPAPVVLSLEAGTILCPDPTSGGFSLVVGGAATQVPPGSYPFQLWLVAPDAVPLPPFSGSIVLTPSLVYP